MRRASAGTTNRSDWPGPVWEKARTRTVSSPLPSHACSARNDAATLLAPYGVIGRSGASSREREVVGRRLARTPRRCPTTSTRRTPHARAASSTLAVPSTLTRRHAVGSRHDAPTSDQRGEVVHDLGSVRGEHVVHRVAVGDVERRRPDRVAREHDVVAARAEMRDEVRTDEAGRAGDERLHPGTADAARHGWRDRAPVRVDVRVDRALPGERRGPGRPGRAQARRDLRVVEHGGERVGEAVGVGGRDEQRGVADDLVERRARRRHERRAARERFERGQAEALLERRDTRRPRRAGTAPPASSLST